MLPIGHLINTRNVLKLFTNKKKLFLLCDYKVQSNEVFYIYLMDSDMLREYELVFHISALLSGNLCPHNIVISSFFVLCNTQIHCYGQADIEEL